MYRIGLGLGLVCLTLPHIIFHARRIVLKQVIYKNTIFFSTTLFHVSHCLIDSGMKIIICPVMVDGGSANPMVCKL